MSDEASDLSVDSCEGQPGIKEIKEDLEELLHGNMEVHLKFI